MKYLFIENDGTCKQLEIEKEEELRDIDDTLEEVYNTDLLVIRFGKRGFESLEVEEEEESEGPIYHIYGWAPVPE